MIMARHSELLFTIQGGPNAKEKIQHHDRLKRFPDSDLPAWVAKKRKEAVMGKPAPPTTSTAAEDDPSDGIDNQTTGPSPGTRPQTSQQNGVPRIPGNSQSSPASTGASSADQKSTTKKDDSPPETTVTKTTPQQGKATTPDPIPGKRPRGRPKKIAQPKTPDPVKDLSLIHI